MTNQEAQKQNFILSTVIEKFKMETGGPAKVQNKNGLMSVISCWINHLSGQQTRTRDRATRGHMGVTNGSQNRANGTGGGTGGEGAEGEGAEAAEVSENSEI
jgi:hypothetical protein